MACNCASSEQIKALYARYGDKRQVKKLPFMGKVKYYIQYFFLCLSMIIITPFLFIYVFYKGFFDLEDHKISLKKFFNIKNNLEIDAEQQVI